MSILRATSASEERRTHLLFAALLGPMCILQKSGSREAGGGAGLGQGRRLLNEGDEGVYQLIPSGPVVAGNVHAPDVVPAGRYGDMNQG